jgi:hypothetical protein
VARPDHGHGAPHSAQAQPRPHLAWMTCAPHHRTPAPHPAPPPVHSAAPAAGAAPRRASAEPSGPRPGGSRWAWGRGRGRRSAARLVAGPWTRGSSAPWRVGFRFIKTRHDSTHQSALTRIARTRLGYHDATAEPKPGRAVCLRFYCRECRHEKSYASRNPNPTLYCILN